MCDLGRKLYEKDRLRALSVLNVLNPFVESCYTGYLSGSFWDSRSQVKTGMCTTCAATSFVNLLYSSEDLFHHSKFADRNSYIWFIKKTCLVLEDTKHIDKLDSIWLSSVSHNYKLLCMSYILHKDHLKNPNNPNFPCKCEVNIPRVESYLNAVRNVVGFRMFYQSPAAHEDPILNSAYNIVFAKEARENQEAFGQSMQVVRHHTENLSFLIKQDIYDSRTTTVISNLADKFLSTVVDGLELDTKVGELIQKHYKFYRGFRLQAFWQEDTSFRASRLKFRARLLNRITHPRYWRKRLKFEFTDAVRVWLANNRGHFSISFGDFWTECFIELFWLAVLVDSLEAGARGKLVFQPAQYGMLQASRNVCQVFDLS